MDRKSKISVGLILCIATLGCICSIIRFRYVSGLTEVVDFFWNAVNVSIWSTIEAGASIMAGCLATLRPLLKRFLTTVRESTVLSNYIKHISQSLRSGSTVHLKSNVPSTLRHDTMMSDLTRTSRQRQNRSTVTYTNNSESMDFLTRPDPPEAPAPASETGSERKSIDPIVPGQTGTNP